VISIVVHSGCRYRLGRSVNSCYEVGTYKCTHHFKKAEVKNESKKHNISKDVLNAE
jgi:hypothetical protein